MPLFEAADIADMRALRDEALPDACDIYRATETTNALGETIVSYPPAPTISNVPCRFRDIHGLAADAEAIQALQLSPDIEARLTFTLGTDVRSSDRIGYDGRIWRVAHVAVPDAWSVGTRAYISVQGATA